MLQIQDTLVSLDVVEKFFCCDIQKCLGECCIDGDAGAPLSPEEFETLNECLDELLPRLTPAAREAIKEGGIAYYDQEGDLVTQIVNGKECVFTNFAPGGVCMCAIEQAWNEGKVPIRKPISCALYPVRLKEFADFTAVNYHRWKICRSAESCGRATGLRVYQFLKGPLTQRFGEEWYRELELTASEWIKQNNL